MPWGELSLQNGYVTAFKEKGLDSNRWINAGIFAISANVLDYIQGRDEMLEQQPVERMITNPQVVAPQHKGSWQGTDTIKERRIVEASAAKGLPRWQKMLYS